MAAELDATAKLAVQYHNAGALATAEKLYGHVLLVKPDHGLCLHNLGLIQLKRNDLAAALDLLEAAARADPGRPLFHSTLGNARLQAGDADGSHASFCRAVDLDSANSAAWDGLGVALRRLQRLEESIAAHRRALTLNPASRAAAHNLGITLIDVGELEEAERILARLLEDNPLDPDVAIQRGIIRLTRGDFRGWDEYAWNHWSQEWLKTDPPILVPLPQWDGQLLPDDGLMLYGEQGVGDEVMFATFVAAAAARAGRAVLLCEPRLVPLFARSFPAVAVAAKPAGGEPPLLGPQTNCAMRCSLSRLPGVLGVQRGDFAGDAYLHADPMAVERWRQRLAGLGDGLKVGISWRGGNNDTTRATRSLSLDSLAPLFAIPGVRFVNVQYGSHAAEIAAFNAGAGQELACFEDVDPLRDMDGLAALLCALDLVISVDNSTVHLAGALGAPVWMLCPFNANWRWARQGETNPWYGSVRLFRQDEYRCGAWESVITRMAGQLRDLAALPRRQPHPPSPPPASGRIEASLAPSADVLLVNDSTYWHHWGCTGTSLALHQGLRAARHVVDSVPTALMGQLGPLPEQAAELDDEAIFLRFSQRNPSLLRRMQAVSEVVIHGGDSIHGRGQSARALLYLAWIARRRLGKRTSIVNHSCYPGGNGTADTETLALYTKVYGVLDGIAVNDARSAAELARLGITATESFDCLPLFIAALPRGGQPHERRVVIAGGTAQDPALLRLLEDVATLALKHKYSVDVLVGASAFFAKNDLQLVTALHSRLSGRYRLVAATSEQQWLQAIAGAQLLVSGRYHHSIAAACLGTPVALAGSAPKIDGLIERLGLGREQAWLPALDRDAAASRVTALLRNPGRALVSQERLARLRELAQQNFAGLRPADHPTAPGSHPVS